MQNQHNPNIAWLYYRKYYHIGTSQNEVEHIEKQNEYLLSLNLGDYEAAIQQLNANLKRGANLDYSAATSGRGFLTGIGIQHEMNITGEFKMGMSFDHSSGLPFITGSSLKGAFKAVFDHTDYLIAILEEEELELVGGNTPAALKALKTFLFEEKPLKGRPCQFIGACLSPLDSINIAAYRDRKIFRRDVITPHGKTVTKKPIPLPFMTINRKLYFHFYCLIDDQKSLVHFKGGNEDLKKLFVACSKYEGFGAKKNYDFGRFV